jgi:hypothetical protein
LDHGAWQAPGGLLHPFLVMQWVDGEPLYEHACQHPPSHAQVLRWLAQLTEALAAFHAQGAVHPMKGANVRVRRSDGRAVLMGCGTGTSLAYLSPESWLFERQFSRAATARYHSTPADDLYALGVIACRLLTGEYPELAAPSKDEHGTWRRGTVHLPLALLSGLHAEPTLRDVVRRLLSVPRDQRGSAAQWAEALEQAASRAVPEAPPPSVTLKRPLSPWRGWRWAALAAGLAMAVWAWPDTRGESQEELALAAAEASEENAGTRGLGEAAAATSMEQAPAPSFHEKLAEEALPEPQPGQTQPNAKGQCPRKGQMALNKGCWLETSSLDREGCAELSGQMFKGRCYVPIIPPGRRPTSSPTDKP